MAAKRKTTAKGRNGKPADMLGAPRKYDRDEMVPAICARLATGEPLAVICRDLGVPVRTVNDWRAQDGAIAAQFDEARDLGFDAIAWKSREIARGRGDSTGDVQRDKLIIDTDHKLLAKWDPRRYGEKQQLEHTGPGGGPIESKTVVINEQQLGAALDKLQREY